MDNIYVIIFIVIPISMFGTGFLAARQLRALENVPLFSMMFVQRRLLFSFVMGFFISLMFMLIFGFITGFSAKLIFVFIGTFLLATFSYYFGVNFGWGKSESSDESISTATTQAETETSFPENIIIRGASKENPISNSYLRWHGASRSYSGRGCVAGIFLSRSFVIRC